MTKKELKYYLRIYYKIREDVKNKKISSLVILYGRKRKVLIPKWVYCLEDILLIIRNRGGEFDVIINKFYFGGLTDKRILVDEPLSESSYYRLKRKLEESIYELLILYGYVSEDEILNQMVTNSFF